jgi:Potential Queuosine, Q, salvage protein family
MKVLLTTAIARAGKAHASTGIPITNSDFWQSEDDCSEGLMKWVFRSATNEDIPLFDERLSCLREAGRILYEVGVNFDPLLSH